MISEISLIVKLPLLVCVVQPPLLFFQSDPSALWLCIWEIPPLHVNIDSNIVSLIQHTTVVKAHKIGLSPVSF